MQVLSVWLPKEPASHGDAFHRLAARCARQIDTGPVTIEWQEVVRDDHRIFRFRSWCGEEYTAESHDIARAFVALVIVEWIIGVLEPELIRTLVRREQAHMRSDQWEDVLPYVERALNDWSAGHQGTGLPGPRKAAMFRKVFACLEEHPDLHLYGLARFRLKRERQDLRDAVEAGWEEYLHEQEYQEFLDLLRYFVGEQETKCGVIHVTRKAARRFFLYDESGAEVLLEGLEALLRLSGREWRDEDYLLSALISLSPREVVLHVPEGLGAWGETLVRVFGERLTICAGCSGGEPRLCPLDSVLPAPYNT